MSRYSFILATFVLFAFANLQAQTPVTGDEVVPHFAQVAPGIYRGGTPELSNGVAYLHEQGIKTIINLQGADLVLKYSASERSDSRNKEGEAAVQLGMKYFNLAIPAAADFSDADKENMGRAVRIMSSPEFQPVYVHCKLGNDRTGVVIGLYRILFQDWTAKQSNDEMTENGHRGLRGFFTPYLSPFLFRISDEKDFALKGKPVEDQSFFDALKN